MLFINIYPVSVENNQKLGDIRVFHSEQCAMKKICSQLTRKSA